MRKALVTLLILQLVSLLPIIVHAAEKPQDFRTDRAGSGETSQEVTADGTAVLPAQDSALAGEAQDRPAVAVTKTAFMLEIEALEESERAQLAELRARLETAPDEAAALAIQMEARQLKRETELEILRVQVRSARELGRLDTVERLEQAIEFLTNPRPVTPPAERARPRAQQR